MSPWLWVNGPFIVVTLCAIVFGVQNHRLLKQWGATIDRYGSLLSRHAATVARSAEVEEELRQERARMAAACELLRDLDKAIKYEGGLASQPCAPIIKLLEGA